MPVLRLIRQSCLVLAILGQCTSPAVAQAESGVHDDLVLFGQSAALEGPAAELGRGMKRGLELAFAESNQAGGVAGRRLALVALDDGYEPTRAISNALALIEDQGVFALIGGVGTPTSRAVVPIAEERGVPFLAPFTGAAFLRDPQLSQVINLRASYQQETERGVDYLVGSLRLERIAVLFQDDTFGRDGLDGVRVALERRGLAPVADATYKRNTTAVKRAALDLRAAAPQAVFIIGAYEPAAAFIRTCQALGFNPRFITLSFVGSAALAKELGAAGRGVLVTQVMPPLQDANRPLVARFLAALDAHQPGTGASQVELEGYAAGRLVVETLQRLGAAPTRKTFVGLLRAGEMAALDGLDLGFGPDSNQGYSGVFLTEIRADGSLAEIRP